MPAAVILRVAPDNTRSTEFPFVAGAAGFEAAAIRFGEDRLFLDFYATDVRGSNNVQLLLGGDTITPLYASSAAVHRARSGYDKVAEKFCRTWQQGRDNRDFWRCQIDSVELNFGN